MRDYDWLIPIAFGMGMAVLSATPLMRWSEIAPGDWLGFAGALLGVGLAVTGALAVERRKLKWQRREDLRQLVDAIERIETVSKLLPMPAPGAPDSADLDQKQRALLLVNAMAALEHVIQRVPPRNVALWSVLDICTAGFPAMKQTAIEVTGLTTAGMLAPAEIALRVTTLTDLLVRLKPFFRRARDLADNEMKA